MTDSKTASILERTSELPVVVGLVLHGSFLLLPFKSVSTSSSLVFMALWSEAEIF